MQRSFRSCGGKIHDLEVQDQGMQGGSSHQEQAGAPEITPLRGIRSHKGKRQRDATCEEQAGMDPVVQQHAWTQERA